MGKKATHHTPKVRKTPKKNAEPDPKPTPPPVVEAALALAAKAPRQDAAPKFLDVFICYRRIDGTDIARKIKTLLDRQIVKVKGEDHQVLVYIDETMGGVIDWKAHNHDALEDALCLLLLLTPGVGADISGTDEPDWVRKELSWWRKNRESGYPLILDTTGEGLRYLPEEFRDDWKDVNRVTAPRAALTSTRADDEYARVVKELVLGIQDRFDPVMEEKRKMAERKKRQAHLTMAILGALIVTLLFVSWVTQQQRGALDVQRIENAQSKRMLNRLVVRTLSTMAAAEELEGRSTRAIAPLSETLRISTPDTNSGAYNLLIRDRLLRAASTGPQSIRHIGEDKRPLAVDETGNLLAVESEGTKGLVEIWQVSEGKMQVAFRVDVQAESDRLSATFGKGGKYVAVWFNREKSAPPSLVVSDVKTGAAIYTGRLRENDGELALDDRYVYYAYDKETQQEDTEAEEEEEDKRWLDIHDLASGTIRTTEFSNTWYRYGSLSMARDSVITAFQPDGDLQLAASGDKRWILRYVSQEKRDVLDLVEADTLQAPLRFPFQHSLLDAQISPGGKYLKAVTGDLIEKAEPSEASEGGDETMTEQRIRVWTLPDGKEVATPENMTFSGSFRLHSISEDSNRLAMTSMDDLSPREPQLTLGIWDLESGEMDTASLSESPTAVEFGASGDSVRLLSASGSVETYDWRAGGFGSSGAPFKIGTGNTTADQYGGSVWSLPKEGLFAVLGRRGKILLYPWYAGTRTTELHPRAGNPREWTTFMAPGHRFVWKGSRRLGRSEVPSGVGQYYRGPNDRPAWESPGAYLVRKCVFDSKQNSLLLAVRHIGPFNDGIVELDMNTGKSKGPEIPAGGQVIHLRCSKDSGAITALVRKENNDWFLVTFPNRKEPPTHSVPVARFGGTYLSGDGEWYVNRTFDGDELTISSTKDKTAKFVLETSSNSGFPQMGVIGLIEAAQKVVLRPDEVEVSLPKATICLSSTNGYCIARDKGTGKALLLEDYTRRKARFSDDARLVCIAEGLGMEEPGSNRKTYCEVMNTLDGNLIARFNFNYHTYQAFFEDGCLVVGDIDGLSTRIRLQWPEQSIPSWLSRLGEAMVGERIKDFRWETLPPEELAKTQKDLFEELKKDADAGSALAKMVREWMKE